MFPPLSHVGITVPRIQYLPLTGGGRRLPPCRLLFVYKYPPTEIPSSVLLNAPEPLKFGAIFHLLPSILPLFFHFIGHLWVILIFQRVANLPSPIRVTIPRYKANKRRRWYVFDRLALNIFNVFNNIINTRKIEKNREKLAKMSKRSKEGALYSSTMLPNDARKQLAASRGQMFQMVLLSRKLGFLLIFWLLLIAMNGKTSLFRHSVLKWSFL